MGKLDDNGQVSEDLRGQVLGQLGSSLRYDRLYQEAILDPSLRRTRQELEVAITNASLAREVVFELFQDIERFDLGDYHRFDDEGRGMRRLLAFAQHSARLDGGELKPVGEDLLVLQRPNSEVISFTTDRDKALQEEDLNLLGLEHPVINQWLDTYTSLVPEDRALVGDMEGTSHEAGLITVWLVVVHGKGGQVQQRVVRLGLTEHGERSPYLERLSLELLRACPPRTNFPMDRGQLSSLVNVTAPRLLHRELIHSGFLSADASYSSRLLACIGLGGQQ